MNRRSDNLLRRAGVLAALLAFSLLIIPEAQAQRRGRVQREIDPAIQEYFQMARQAFRADRAYDVVAFTEGRFRLPGNSGFDATIHRVEQELLAAGYMPEESAEGHPFTYRIEERPLRRPTWEPVDASLTIQGEEKPLLTLYTNFNMLAINSHSTPPEGIEGDLVYVGRGREEDFEGKDVEGKIVLGEGSARGIFQRAVQQRGALGILSFSRLSSYKKPEIFRHSIQFSSIPYDPDKHSWGVLLSLAAYEHLMEAVEKGPVRVLVKTASEIYESEELTLVADVHGSEAPKERFVFSAHVQEPGANDNASGVATQSEMACALARMVAGNMPQPRRSISFIWGDEMSSTRRYLDDDPERTEGVRWGMSLDMVGENTSLTGGTFLIEKMPDPSAVWTRGEDRHTEWYGGRGSMSEDRLTPHYFNDFVLARCLDQASASRWIVRTNPYEGGSDHDPFLRAGKPGLLLWHFTDYFYHTDADRLDKVSASEMRNVGVSALVSALVLTSADGAMAAMLSREIATAAIQRLDTEYQLSKEAVEGGGDVDHEVHILEVWRDWYVEAIRMTSDIEVGGSSVETMGIIEENAMRVKLHGDELIDLLRSSSNNYHW